MSGIKESKEDRQVGVDLGLTEEEKINLREIAQTVIGNRVLNKPLPKFEGKTEKLNEKRGAFVTLHKGGLLRGCIGNIRGRHPLYQTVAQMAEEAAFNDPRFPPLSKEELTDVDIEISALTPLRRIEDVEEITVGRDGIYIEKGFFSGLLLPQVATEHDWDRQTFLEQTCFKAGLHKDAWKEKDTKIYVFSADIF
jgi:AmmeMemoRadiSam system protein A